MEKKIQVSRGQVTCSKLSKSEYNKAGMLTAELRQAVTTITTYPSATISDGISDVLFGSADFDLADGQSFTNSSNRVYFMNVPVLHPVTKQPLTQESINASIAELIAEGQNPCIYKVISNSPVLTPNQEAAVKSGLQTMDFFAEKQVVRFPNAHAQAGQICLDQHGNIQYRNVFYKTSLIEDENNCDPNGVLYTTPKLEAELGRTSKVEIPVVNEGGGELPF